MNGLYDGREQSQAKHAIVRRYLNPFAHKILRTWPSLDFIEGFSGPWDNRDEEELSDTSIGIALETLSEVASSLGHSPSAPRIRCIFNELDPQAYAKLQDFLRRSTKKFPLVEVRTFRGKFEDNAPAIKVAATNAFQLLFVDPKGYTGFPPSALEHFKGRSTEVFVNVMRSFIARFISGNHPDREKALVELVGEKRAAYLIDTGLTIETVEAEYLSMLRGTLGYRYAGLSPIHNPDKNQIHFSLAYGTNHPAGMEVMRNAEYRALSDHDRARFAKSTRNEGPSLFDVLDEPPEIRGPYLKARKLHQGQAHDILLGLIDANPKGITFEDLCGMAQQTLFLRRTELAQEIIRMSEAGTLVASWKDRNGRTPAAKDKIERA